MRSKRGFTLLEVMLGLALLGLALTVLIKSAANSIFNAEQAHMMGVSTDLARGKMYDIEEKLIKDGFTDSDQSECDKTFADEGFANVHYCAKVEQVEMPDWDTLQAMAQGHAKAGSGSAAGSAFGSGFLGSNSVGGFQNSMLGGMLSMFGGGKKDVTGSQGGALIQGQYGMFQQILKVSVRKVTLTITYKVFGSDRDMKVVAFFTDAGAMDKVINGLGSQELPDPSTTNTNTNPKTPTKTPTK
jgi:general secretion pathway protein I